MPVAKPDAAGSEAVHIAADAELGVEDYCAVHGPSVKFGLRLVGVSNCVKVLSLNRGGGPHGINMRYKPFFAKPCRAQDAIPTDFLMVRHKWANLVNADISRDL